MAAIAAQAPGLPSTPLQAINPPAANHVADGNANRSDGSGMNTASGPYPFSQPPPPAPPAPAIGSASPATPLSTGTPPSSTQSHLRSHDPHQLPPLQTALGNRLPTTQNGRVTIVEPPGQGGRRSNAPAPAFASPTRDSQSAAPKINEDISRLTHAIQQSIPEAVRHVIRDNWQKALLGTEFHQAFVMNAAVHHASSHVVKHAIKDFGQKMISESKEEIIGQFTAKDLDDVADLIFERASDAFLDKALERRLGTIDARSLINALARAERLGYENNDAMDERPDLTPMSAGPVPSPSIAPVHVKKQLCTKQPPSPAGFDYSCEHCGAGFITGVGQQYHHANKVCGAHEMASATPKGDTAMTNTSNAPSGHGSPTVPAAPAPQTQPGSFHPAYHTPLPVPNLSATSTIQPAMSTSTVVQAPLQYNFTPSNAPKVPAQYNVTPSNTSNAPPLSSPTAADPYAHLTPENRENMDAELRRAELSYAPRFKEAEKIEDPLDRKLKLENLLNGFSTKQSNIRKKYGVRLRQRRTKAEIDAERARVHGIINTPVKRRRTDAGTENSTPTWSSVQQPASARTPESSAPTASEPVSNNHLSIASLSTSGLGKASATEATTDPTTAQSQNTVPSPPPAAPLVAGRSLSSMQRSGYRISAHASRHSASAEQSPALEEQEPVSVGWRASVEAQAKTQSPPVQEQKRGASAAEPVVLDDDSNSSSDSDSDEEIPALIAPTKRASGSPK
ncbi:hypothetical protein SCAR479_07609 [Seiridium cardinale]|uniref:C2H2-type domain-containing protein n=1 Tax=Seiridium cardinale TaxID=138064 RepID=A0ABR2XPS4_9PEZI